jgi:hypothetical protein
MKDKILREHILGLLNGGMAYDPIDKIIKDFPADSINTKFPNGEYGAWQLMEHIRLTQFVTLDFLTNKNYIELKWPDAYWPTKKNATKKDWDESIKKFKSDMKKIQKLLMDPKTDLYGKVPNGTGQTYLREFLLIADHNSYHLGEFSIMRQVLDTWPPNHK